MPATTTSLGSIARRSWWLIALVASVLALAGLAVGLLREPTYTATVQLNVGTLDARAQAVPGYVEAAKSLASSYSRIATTERVVRPVAQAARLSPEEVRERITVTPVLQNPIISVEAEGPSREEAEALSRTTARGLIAEVERVDTAGGADAELLDEFRAASRRLAEAELRLRSLQRRREADTGSVPRASIERQQAEVETRRLESTTIGNLYAEARTRAGSASQLELIGEPASITSDRSSTIQQLVFAGLLAGAVIGLALATLREGAAARRRRGARVAA
jgi:capsular polysaccharide biosynthesis protein